MKQKIVFATALAVMLAPAAFAQSDSSNGGVQGSQTASINLAAAHKGTVHGHAQNPLGQPIAEALVFATTDGSPKSSVAQFSTDAQGNYKGVVPEGTYVFVLQSKEQKGTQKEIDDSGQVHVGEKEDKLVDFDGTREAYMKKLNPEELKQLEELKKKNAAVTANNAVVLKLNEVLKQERDARAAKQYDQAADLATQITQGKPQEAVGWLELGMDQSLQNKYDQAVPNLQKSIDLTNASGKPNPEIIRVANTYLGDDAAQQGKGDDAIKYYGVAAGADPTKASTIYVNGAIIAYNKQQLDAANMLADKAIAADPKNAQAYYMKGQSLVQKVSMDKQGKPIVPPGCLEAYKKYLELDPNGAHATEVAAIIQGLGATVSVGTKSGKK